jgi:hypothetical protein
MFSRLSPRKAIIALTLGSLVALPANAQLAVEDNVYYYTSTATINTDIRGKDVVIGRMPGGAFADAGGDTNIADPYTVTIASGAQVSRNDFFNDGYSGVELFNTTTLNVTGGTIESVRSFNASAVNINGGTVGGLGVYDATITISSGVANYVRSYGTGTINVTGGAIGNGIVANGPTNISGGNIDYINGWTDSVVNITNGAIGYLTTLDTSVINISGGVLTEVGGGGSSLINITNGNVVHVSSGGTSTVNVYDGIITHVIAYQNGAINIYGGTIGNNTLYARNNGLINLFGTGFSLSDALGMGSDSNGQYTYYNLTGVLQNGDVLNNTFRDYAGGFDVGGPNSPIVFNAASAAAPEPGTLTLLGLGGMALIGAARRRRIGKR